MFVHVCMCVWEGGGEEGKGEWEKSIVPIKSRPVPCTIQTTHISVSMWSQCLVECRDVSVEEESEVVIGGISGQLG